MYTPKMKMSKKSNLRSLLQLFCLLFLSGFLFPGFLSAQEGAGGEEKKNPPQKFTFSGNSTSISFAEGNQRTILTGDAFIASENLDIEAQRIELYGKDFRYARCSEDVKVNNAEQKISLSAQALFYDRDLEFLRIRGYTEMIDMNNELVIKCGYLEHYDREEYSIFQIGVRILKATEDGRMVCRSDFARYDRKEDLLELTGSPIVYWKGDRYSAVRITINLENDEITMQGDVEGEFTSENESS